jgi:hypothetical protein
LNSTKIICDRFTKFSAAAIDEIRLRVNLATDDLNRIIEIEAVRKLEQVPEVPGQIQTAGYGVKVRVDVNNRDVSKKLDYTSIPGILHEGRLYNKRDLYNFLNGQSGGVQ